MLQNYELISESKYLCLEKEKRFGEKENILGCIILFSGDSFLILEYVITN